MIGKTLSHYRVTAALGAGGMGEVYRATDTKLNREVAIKVLPREVAEDPERLTRFEREAQLLAALNHPNIAAIYGLEEVGGTPFLALELVEGEDLKERLDRGALPVEEALELATQIAEALEAAHARGIVHRDLKPANVKVTPEGKVKVLDFGLAKAWAGEAMSGSAPDLSQSPTLANTGTAAGLILGTAAYMSPEQARGRPVDTRSDVWAFGVLLFEMLTGRPLFQGETVSDVLAAVLRQDPDWSALPETVPPAARRTLRRCLVRAPAGRLHHIADARLEIQADESEIPRGTARPRGPGWLAAAALAACSALLAVGATVSLRPPPPAEAPAAASLRFEVGGPQDGALTGGGLALSPDGRSLAFTARDGERGSALWVRSFDSLRPRRLEDTEGARYPFWSPDASHLGFFKGTELVVVELIGGSRRTLAPTADTDAGLVRGATWGANDVIVYSPTFSAGLMRVSAAPGSTPEPATRLDPEAGDGTHRFPTFLPDGRHFVFYASVGSGVEPGEICVGELGSLEVRRLTRAHSAPAFLAPHFLVFARGEALVAQEIDLERLELRGDPVPLGVTFPPNPATSGYRALTSAGGVVAYRVESASLTRVVWVDRDGRELETVADPVAWHTTPRISPDERRITVSSNDGGPSDGDIWVLDLEKDNRTRLTFDPRDDWAAAWSPDGRRLAIASIGPASVVYLADPDQPGAEREWWRTDRQLNPAPVWLPDGQGILLDLYGEDNQLDVWRVPLPGQGEPAPFIATSFNEHTADVSADGRWVAYVSNSSGRDEVYVRAIVGEGTVWTVSTEGGSDPTWRADGREIFYEDPAGRIVAVPTTVTPTFTKGPPEVLFDGQLSEYVRQYDVSADGQRFLMVRGLEGENPVVVVLGWAHEIESWR